MINQSLEEATERSTTVTSSKNAGRRRSTMPRSGFFKIRYELWQKEEERRKDFSACIEKAVCMKTQEELYTKVRSTPRLPRVVLRANSQRGQQDQREQDARPSWEPSSASKSYGETCNNTVDYRTSGVPLSAVERQNTIRENKSKTLIEKFENHQHKESFLQDLSQMQKINKFSRESQDLFADLNNTEIFKLCENPSKQQCVDCNAYWEMGIIYCSCGRNMTSTRSPTEFDQNNRDVTSIPE